jgi:hypothetical protein
MKCVDGAVTDTVGRSVLRYDREEGLELGKEERRNHKGTRNDCRGQEKGPGPGLLCIMRGFRAIFLIAFGGQRHRQSTAESTIRSA